MVRARRLAVLVPVVTLLVGLAACEQPNGGEKGPATIKLLEYQKIRADAVAKLLPEFEAAMSTKGQTVKVELIRDILPDGQFKTKITQQYSARNAPDVTDYAATHVPGFAGAGYLLDLTPYLEKWPEWERFYPEVKKQIVQPDGKTYMLPHEANTQSLFYRKDVLDQLGISTEQPATWPELIERLNKIKAKTGKPAIVLPAGTAWGNGTFVQGFLNVVLGRGSSSLYNDQTKKWVVRSQGLTDAFTVYADLSSQQLLPNEALLNPEPWQPTKYKAFPAGTLPVAAQGTWGWRYDWGPDGAAPIPDLFTKVHTWGYPAPDAKPYTVSSVGFGYAVTAETKHPDAAVELVKWLSSDKALAQQLVAVGAASPRSGIDDVAPYSQQPYLIETEKQLAASRSFAARPGQEQISQAVGKVTEDILTGKLDGPAAAKAFAAEATKLLSPDQIEGG